MMGIGKRYVVTKGSEDGTFSAGDHVWLDEDGSICCDEAGGWITKEDVIEATKGMEVAIDEEWIARRRAKLLAGLEALK